MVSQNGESFSEPTTGSGAFCKGQPFQGQQPDMWADRWKVINIVCVAVGIGVI